MLTAATFVIRERSWLSVEQSPQQPTVPFARMVSVVTSPAQIEITSKNGSVLGTPGTSGVRMYPLADVAPQVTTVEGRVAGKALWCAAPTDSRNKKTRAALLLQSLFSILVKISGLCPR